MVYQWLNSFISTWLPQSCVLCGLSSHRQALCPDCLQDLPRLSPDLCPRCGLPAGLSNAQDCGHCLQLQPAYHRVYSAFGYAPPVSQLVARLKFRGQIQLARLFGELLAQRLAEHTIQADALLPVPLHPNRLRQRGFNQALEIARPLAQAFGLPLLTGGVHRQRDTEPQSTRAASQRGHNLRDAFRLVQLPAYERIAIVDDVMTSGHTANELAKLLREAGVKEIEVWCVARALPHPH
ncbi:MAG: ComF family protein [Gammaproteobacteria bacterium]|nr:ComF family protein [Gammaproteobacteria bacterium]